MQDVVMLLIAAACFVAIFAIWYGLERV